MQKIHANVTASMAVYASTTAHRRLLQATSIFMVMIRNAATGQFDPLPNVYNPALQRVSATIPADAFESATDETGVMYALFETTVPSPSPTPPVALPSVALVLGILESAATKPSDDNDNSSGDSALIVVLCIVFATGVLILLVSITMSKFKRSSTTTENGTRPTDNAELERGGGATAAPSTHYLHPYHNTHGTQSHQMHTTPPVLYASNTAGQDPYHNTGGQDPYHNTGGPDAYHNTYANPTKSQREFSYHNTYTNPKNSQGGFSYHNTQLDSNDQPCQNFGNLNTYSNQTSGKTGNTHNKVFGGRDLHV